jgi:hypothetical protein
MSDAPSHLARGGNRLHGVRFTIEDAQREGFFSNAKPPKWRRVSHLIWQGRRGSRRRQLRDGVLLDLQVTGVSTFAIVPSRCSSRRLQARSTAGTARDGALDAPRSRGLLYRLEEGEAIYDFRHRPQF